jgi:hypothetical protein
MRERPPRQGEGWKLPSFPPERFGVTSQRDTEWLTSTCTPAAQDFEQPLPAAGGEKLKRTYIYCSQPARGLRPVRRAAARRSQVDVPRRQDRPRRDGHRAGEIAKILMAK